MLKLRWFIALVLGFLVCTVIVLHAFLEQKNAFIISTLLSVSCLFTSISIRAMRSAPSRHKSLRWIFLFISLGLLLAGIISKTAGIKGANAEVIFAVMCYCFMYAPFELYLKYQKWRIYSENKWEMLLLSAFDFIGINLVLLGALSIYMYWPGQYYLVYAGFAILSVGLISWNRRFKQEVIRRKISEDKIKLQYFEIEKEKQKSEDLLLNILPSEVAEELKIKGSATARHYDEVTVLFTDFKDFTRVSENMSARELVEEINTCFVAFDKITEKYGIEKIKTIGDSYMCAGGLPAANRMHAASVVGAALEIQAFILQRIAERKSAGLDAFQIRIGIHTGPVVAGIVGIKKFAYDIWGDTVNTASRMESSGEAGKVNISGTTFALVKDQFRCQHRGKISAKGKGEIDMYFVEGKI